MAPCTTGEVSLFSVIISSLREDIDTPTTRTSGVLSPRRCEQINYLGWVRVIIFLFLLLNNEYPQLALLFHALVSSECHLSTTVSLTWSIATYSINGATQSLILSPTMIRSSLSAPPTTQRLSGTSYLSSTQAVSPSSSLRPRLER